MKVIALCGPALGGVLLGVVGRHDGAGWGLCALAVGLFEVQAVYCMPSLEKCSAHHDAFVVAVISAPSAAGTMTT